MKRYSIAPGLTRRKSAHVAGTGSDPAATLELEKLEQEITLTLQEIDKNLSKANAVISEKMFPILAKYAQSSQKVWSNANFWKYFLEQAADVELTSYEAPANLGTNLNTIANSKRADVPESHGETASKSTTGWLEKDPHNTDHVHRLDVAKNLNQNVNLNARAAFAGLEETPTWSPERPQEAIQASTPEPAGKNPNLKNPNLKDPDLKNPTPQMITHTIRQSLDNYHRISISPRKEPRADRAASERHRRDSVIRNFINSSPTLPEPPVLVSEFDDWRSPRKQDKGNPQGQDQDKAQPLVVAGQALLATPVRDFRSQTLQRFPRTPNLGADSQPVDIMRTPLGVRIRYGDDSELAPPEMETNTDKPEDEMQLPDLQTVEPGNKRRRLSTADDERNVFLDQNNRTEPRENTLTNSNLLEAFEEVATNSSITLKQTGGSGEKPQDLFATIEHDTTEGSTSELGQFYRDRLKEFTNYGT